MSQYLIRTPRLQLIAATLDVLAAELEGPQALAALLDVTVPAGWPPGEYDRAALEFFSAQLIASGPASMGWFSWYAIARGSESQRGTLIAGAGYMGPPADGCVEIGYSVVPEARGQGYATEIVEALVARALSVDAVKKVIAHTLETNLTSAGVLARCGFTVVGRGAEPGQIRHERCRVEMPGPTGAP